MKNTSVCAVIVTYNQCQAVCALMEQLDRMELPQAFQRVVVINGSSDNTREELEARWGERSDVHIHWQAENRGGAGGFRRGVEEALKLDSEYFWLLDDDVFPQDNALSTLIEASQKLKVPWGALGSLVAQAETPELVTEAGGGFHWLRAKLRCYYHAVPIEDVPKYPRRVGHCAAASLFIPRFVIEKIGFFEDVFIHFDDVEWCYRAAKAGYPIFSVGASVVHHPFKRGTTPPWIRYYDARNILLVFSRVKPLLLPLAWMRFRMIALVLRLRGDKKSPRLIRLGQRDFFKGKVRMRSELDL